MAKRERRNAKTGMNRKAWTILFVTLLVMSAAFAYVAACHQRQKLGQPGLKLVSHELHDETGTVVATNCVYLPEEIGDYSSTELPVTRLELKWLPKDTTFGRRLYKSPDGFEMMVSAVMMGTDRTSIHKPDYCLSGQGWQVDGRDFVEIPLKSKSGSIPVQKLMTTKLARSGAAEAGAMRGMYIYWFVADGAQTADEKSRTWMTARELLRSGVLQRWSYVSCFAVFYRGQEAATFERMKRFLSEAVPYFQLNASPTLAIQK